MAVSQVFRIIVDSGMMLDPLPPHIGDSHTRAKSSLYLLTIDGKQRFKVAALVITQQPNSDLGSLSQNATKPTFESADRIILFNHRSHRPQISIVRKVSSALSSVDGKEFKERKYK